MAIDYEAASRDEQSLSFEQCFSIVVMNMETEHVSHRDSCLF